MPEVKVPSELTAGIRKIEVAAGTSVEEGDTLILLESMKTEIPVPAPRKGRVKSILVEEGEQVEEGQTLVVLEY